MGEDDGRSILILISDRDRNLYAARPESYTGLIASLMGLVNLYVMTKLAESSSNSVEEMGSYQNILFLSSMLTGWVLLGSMIYVG